MNVLTQGWESVGQIEGQEGKEIEGTSENEVEVAENEGQIGLRRMRIQNGINPTGRRKRAERLQGMAT